MDVKTLVDVLVEEQRRWIKEFLNADAAYHEARVKGNQEAMTAWLNLEKTINTRIGDITTTLRIIKEFTGEGLCF